MNWNTRLALPAEARALRTWLTSPGSLTARLSAVHPGFHVRLLFQGSGRPTADEAAAVGLRPGRLGGVREVLLCSAQGPVVFAHTVWRRGAGDGAWRLLQGLGRRPLGHLLFTEAGVIRLPLEYRRLTLRHPLHRRAELAAGRPLPALWSRRSVFILRGRRLLVTEIFLPG